MVYILPKLQRSIKRATVTLFRMVKLLFFRILYATKYNQRRRNLSSSHFIYQQHSCTYFKISMKFCTSHWSDRSCLRDAFFFKVASEQQFQKVKQLTLLSKDTTISQQKMKSSKEKSVIIYFFLQGWRRTCSTFCEIDYVLIWHIN